MPPPLPPGPAARPDSLPSWSLVVIFVAIAAPAWAQSVTAPLVSPGTGTLVAAAGVLPGATPAATRPSPAPFDLWGIALRPHANYQFLYGDGIQQHPGAGEKTAIHSLSPGVELSGDRWRADYTPTWTLYSNAAFADTVNHTASLSGSGSFLAGSYSFSDRYQFSDNPQVETGMQTREKINVATATANFEVARKIGYELSAAQSFQSNDLAPAQRDWSLTNAGHYQFASDWDGGVGVTVGYISVSNPGFDATYVRPHVSFRWRAADKITAFSSVGYENRRFRHDGADTLSTPVYSAGITYNPLATTSFTLIGNRSVQAAYYGNQVTQDTGWSASIRQRFLGVLNFSGAFAYGRARYVLTGGVIQFARDDATYSYQANLGTNFLRRGFVSLIYQRVRNQSTQAGYEFASNQAGFEIGFRY